MEINGLKIRDMKDVQDVLMALETIKLGLENVSDNMDNNYKDYISLNYNIADSVSTQKGIVEGISHLQIKGNDLLKYLEQLNNNVKIVNNKSISNLKEEFSNFDMQIERTLSTVINGIDLSRFRRQVETLFNDKINSLENEVRRLKRNIDYLYEINNKLDKTIDYNKDNLIATINDFNELSKLVNYKVVIGSILGGILMGGILMGGFGISFLKDKIFNDEQIAIEKYNYERDRLEQKYIKASKLEQQARKYNINYVTDNDGNKYITVPANKVEETFLSNANYQVIKLK